MESCTVVNLGEVAPYSGPGTLEGIRFRAVREALGVSAFGINVLDLDANCENHPEHSHQSDGHEEVYVVTQGSVVLVIDGSETELKTGDAVRVPGALTRKLVTKGESATILALGGTPGVYVPSMGG